MRRLLAVLVVLVVGCGSSEGDVRDDVGAQSVAVDPQCAAGCGFWCGDACGCSACACAVDDASACRAWNATYAAPNGPGTPVPEAHGYQACDRQPSALLDPAQCQSLGLPGGGLVFCCAAGVGGFE
jgi:hypothetical protein